MSRFTEQQVSKMVVNPYTKEDLFEVYPKLLEIKTIVDKDKSIKNIDWDRYFRFLSFCYDPYSPMVFAFPALSQRKAMAMEETDYSGEEYPVISAYFVATIINNRVWHEIISNENVFDEYMVRVNKPIGADMDDGNTMDEDKQLKAVELKNRMLKQMNEMRKNIATLRNELFQGDESLRDINANKVEKFTAEGIAKFMRNNESKTNSKNT